MYFIPNSDARSRTPDEVRLSEAVPPTIRSKVTGRRRRRRLLLLRGGGEDFPYLSVDEEQAAANAEACAVSPRQAPNWRERKANRFSALR